MFGTFYFERGFLFQKSFIFLWGCWAVKVINKTIYQIENTQTKQKTYIVHIRL